MPSAAVTALLANPTLICPMEGTDVQATIRALRSHAGAGYALPEGGSNLGRAYWLGPRPGQKLAVDGIRMLVAVRRACSKPCMGLCQGGVSIGDRSAHLFPLSVSLFDLRARFFVPTCTSLAAGAHRNCQGWPSHQPFPTSSAVARPHLDSFEHDGTLGAIGMTIRGEPAFGRDQSRHNLVSGGSKDPNHDAVMRIGSEAPRRRTHSSFRH